MTRPRSNVVVLGGYGNFGAVIAAKLAAVEGVEVIVAGRDVMKAGACASRIGATAVRLDGSDAALADKLQDLDAALVISTAGPFQHQDYSVARAAIEACAHYIDIADARRFVCGITELDAAAKGSDVLVVSGASSVPALAAAVIDRYAPEFAELREIDYGISTSERTPGLATARAALGYCGRPIRQWRNGSWSIVHGWQGLSRHHFKSLDRARWFAWCDVPDLDLFPSRYPAVRTVRFRAGVELRLTQFGMWALSWLVRAGLVRNAAALAPALRRAAIALEPLGSGRSAMFVELAGLGRDGTRLRRLWELIARNNDGVHIPCMAAVCVARKLIAGRLPVRGATACVGLVSLDEYLAELEGLGVGTVERACRGPVG